MSIGAVERRTAHLPRSRVLQLPAPGFGDARCIYRRLSSHYCVFPLLSRLLNACCSDCSLNNGERVCKIGNATGENDGECRLARIPARLSASLSQCAQCRSSTFEFSSVLADKAAASAAQSTPVFRKNLMKSAEARQILAVKENASVKEIREVRSFTHLSADRLFLCSGLSTCSRTTTFRCANFHLEFSLVLVAADWRLVLPAVESVPRAREVARGLARPGRDN